MEYTNYELIADPEYISEYSKDDLDKLLRFTQQLRSIDGVSEAQIDLENQSIICKVNYEIDNADIELIADSIEGFEIDTPDTSNVFGAILMEIPFIL